MANSETESLARTEKVSAARLSLLSNALLTVIKLTIGLLTNSVGVLSDGAHSASDVMASAIALYTVREADRPPDEDHPYGHGKMESISALVQALLLFAAGSYIVYEAIQHLLHHEGPKRVDWGMGIMLISAVVNIFIVRFVSRAADRTGSPSLHAAAQDHRADICTAIGVLVGLVLVRLTGNSIFDPILALGVAVVIFRGALLVVRDAMRNLVDRRLPEKEVQIVHHIFDSDPHVLGYHKVRTRMAGSTRHVDAHVMMDDDLTLMRSHQLTEALESKVREALPHSVVTLHTEPFHAECEHQQTEHGGPPRDEKTKLS
jgi:cation diffusion facilitator family transporter